MGRALLPTRKLLPRNVKVGDVVLVRYPNVSYSRWMIVDYAVNFGSPQVWSGRWAFGKDAGTWTIHTAKNGAERYVVKDARDAKRDAKRLATLPRNTHV